jgi:type VI protein secretion system component Hcp
MNLRRPAGRLWRIAALGSLALAAVSGFAAVEGYYRFNGIGSSTDALIANWQPFTSFAANADRPVSALYPNVSDFTFTKFVDKHSVLLVQRVFSGQQLTAATFYLRNSGESFPVFVVNLKGAVVTGYNLAGDTRDGEGRLAEQLSVAFASLETSVSRADPGQTVVSTTAAWNLSTATAVTSAPPTLTLGATTLTTNEDAPATLSYTHADDYSDLEMLTRTATSSNSAVVAPSGLVFSGTGPGRVLTVTPVANASGSATITVTLRDTAGLTTSASFALTVNPVNDAPAVGAINAQTTTVGTPRAVAVTLSDVDTDVNALALTATSDNAAVLPASGITLTGSGATRTLTLTPAAAGSANVTLVASDGAANSAPVTFSFIANQIGAGIPTSIRLSATSVAENSAAGTVIGTLSAVDADQASGHTFALLDNAGGRFALSGNTLVVAPGASLDYESAAAHTVTVRVTDADQQTFAQQLTITVTNVNEAPSVAIGSLGTAAPGRALALTSITLADPDAGADDIRAEFSVLHGALTCDTAGALAGRVSGNQSATLSITAPLATLNAALASGALSYAPAAGFTGEDILQVVVSDLGRNGTGGALSDTRLAALTVAVDSFASWQAANFSADELADPAISGPQAALLGDGYTNLLKYALGVAPRQTVASAPQIAQTATDWTFTFTRPVSRPDLTYAVEVSNNLTTWSTTGVTLTLASTDTTAGTQTWRASYPKGASPTQFMRLSVTLAAP